MHLDGVNPVGRAQAEVDPRVVAGQVAVGAQAQAQPLPQTADPDFIAYCSRRYRSFDPVSGTFLANDGQRYPCQYP